MLCVFFLRQLKKEESYLSSTRIKKKKALWHWIPFVSNKSIGTLWTSGWAGPASHLFSILTSLSLPLALMTEKEESRGVEGDTVSYGKAARRPWATRCAQVSPGTSAHSHSSFSLPLALVHLKSPPSQSPSSFLPSHRINNLVNERFFFFCSLRTLTFEITTQYWQSHYDYSSAQNTPNFMCTKSEMGYGEMKVLLFEVRIRISYNL